MFVFPLSDYQASVLHALHDPLSSGIFDGFLDVELINQQTMDGFRRQEALQHTACRSFLRLVPYADQFVGANPKRPRDASLKGLIVCVGQYPVVAPALQIVVVHLAEREGE
ncbi:hypothetical protein NKI54_35760, partial [Mesorhizobium sp. M0663]